MALVALEDHEWSIIKYTPIEVLRGDDGEPVVFVVDEGEEAYGCVECHTALSAESLGTHCPGDAD